MDPSKIKPNENLEVNYQHLEELTENLLHKIIESIDECPMFELLYSFFYSFQFLFLGKLELYVILL